MFPGGFYPLQPLQRSLPGQVALHIREYYGQMQHRPSQGAVLVDGLSEADDFDAILSQPAQQLQHLGQRPALPVQRSDLHAVARLEGGLQEIQPRPVPGGPAAHILKDLLAIGQHPALVLQAVGVRVAGHRHAGVSIGLPVNLSMAPGSGMAARYCGGQGSGYAHICPFLTELAGRKARS